MEVMIVTAGKTASTTATTTSGRIAVTAVVVTITTNVTRNERTRLPLIVVTRCSSHAQCTGQRASTPLRSATRNQKTTKVNFKTKKRHYKVQHNDTHYTSNNDESRFSTNTLVPSEDPASASSKSEKTHEDENYHLCVAKKNEGRLLCAS